MKSFAIATIVALAVAVSAQQSVQSGPYHLKIQSKNATLNGMQLQSWHAGAAIEALVPVAGDGGDEYYFNSTLGSQSPPTYSLVWNLPTSDLVVSSAMQFSYHPSSNLAVPLFFPGGDQYQSVGVDANNRLYVPDYYDESLATPLNAPPSSEKAYYHWQVCWTFTGGYYYHALTWLTAGKPVNPTCQPVDVVRCPV